MTLNLRGAGAVACLLLLGSTAQAEVKLHPLFTDGAVLQRDMPVPVWGTATPNESITATLNGQNATTTADAEGKWSVKFPKLEAGGPHELKVKGTNELTVKDILIGEVWICSGQSNMEWPVRAAADPDKVAAGANFPKIRLFQVPRLSVAEPVDTVNGKWAVCTPDTIKNFTAVGYAFGRNLHEKLNVPVGLISTNWGGTPAQAWTSVDTIRSEKSLAGYAKAYDNGWAEEARVRAEWEKTQADHKAAVAAAKAEGKEAPPAPNAPKNLVSGGRVSGLYNGMIAPLIPYGIRGAIWYQGEANAGQPYLYRSLMRAMIEDWRKKWGEGDFPFIMVQLAPYQKIVDQPQESNWAGLREAQLLTAQKTPNTGIAVITDIGDEKDIHPRQKEPVGYRLALEALRIAYGQNIVSQGPVYKSIKIDGNKAILSFDWVGGGLVAKDGPLKGFTICGEDKKFYNAQAEIVGDTVVVVAPEVAKPIAVRFAWSDCPVVNFWNKDGLPATPFRTDDFPFSDSPR